MVNEAEKSPSNQAVVRRLNGGGGNLPVNDAAGGIGVRASPALLGGCDSESVPTRIVDVSRFVLLGGPARTAADPLASFAR
jgi:hypothetical protein